MLRRPTVSAGLAFVVWLALPSLAPTLAAERPLAFPGAEGEGRFARGGRGGRVLEVTNLDDSGGGSLRDAVETRGPRVVVFRVGGTIELEDDLIVREPFLTIAGQTAPGEGITLKGGSLRVQTGDVIIRFLRVRYGDETSEDEDAVTVEAGSNVILDHCSASWSIDEALSVTGDRWDKVTVQWCFITESLDCSHHKKGCHGYGSLIRGCCGHKVSFHHNLYAHHRTRMPRPGDYKARSLDPVGLFFDFRNNVIYNWSSKHPGYDADLDAVTALTFVGNAYLRGPDSPSAIAFNNSSKAAHGFFAGNTMDGTAPADPWSLVTMDQGVDPLAFRLGAPAPMEPVATEDAARALVRVLKGAGDSFPRRDAVDLRIVHDVEKRTGHVINSQKQIGGWPRVANGYPPLDTDHDGMPDAWELAHGLKPRDAGDGARDRDADGYTNLEEYLGCLIGACPPAALRAAPLSTPVSAPSGKP